MQIFYEKQGFLSCTTYETAKQGEEEANKKFYFEIVKIIKQSVVEKNSTLLFIKSRVFFQTL